MPNGQSWRPINGAPLLAEAFKAGTIPELPQWLADIIRPNRKPNGQGNAPTLAGMPEADASWRGEAYAAAALQGAAAELSTASAGKRNERLNAVAFRLGRMIARGWVDEKSVVDALLGACNTNKYLREHGHRATIKTVESGIEAGKKAPYPNLPDREPAGEGGAELSGVCGVSSRSNNKGTNQTSEPDEGRREASGLSGFLITRVVGAMLSGRQAAGTRIPAPGTSQIGRCSMTGGVSYQTLRSRHCPLRCKAGFFGPPVARV